jgi:predicted porin
MQKTLILALASLPTFAAAQGFEGAVADLQYQKYDDGAGFEVDSLEGHLDAAWGFGMMGAQVGLTLGKEIDSSADIDFRQYNGLTAHLTADVSDNLRLGAMVLADNAADGIALYAAEALYLAGPLRVEGRIGDSLDTEDFRIFEVKGSYAIGSALSARAGFHVSDYGADGDYRVFSLGAGYKVGDSMELYADLSRHKNDFGAGGVYKGDLLSLGVRFNLGGEGERLFSYQPLN